MNALRWQDDGKGLRHMMTGFVVIGMVGLMAAGALAADMDFMGTMVTPAPGRYLVKKMPMSVLRRKPKGSAFPVSVQARSSRLSVAPEKPHGWP